MQLEVGLVSGCSLVGLRGKGSHKMFRPSGCPQEFENETGENKTGSSSHSSFPPVQPDFGRLTHARRTALERSLGEAQQRSYTSVNRD